MWFAFNGRATRNFLALLCMMGSSFLSTASTWPPPHR